jgi:hypothetical protein
MMGYERNLLERQAKLRARATEERERLAQAAAPLQPYVNLTDRALRLGHAVYSHPRWVFVGAAAVAMVKPRRALKVGGRLWAAWRTFQSARRYLDVLLQGRR